MMVSVAITNVKMIVYSNTNNHFNKWNCTGTNWIESEIPHDNPHLSHTQFLANAPREWDSIKSQVNKEQTQENTNVLTSQQ
jgi:hypothetical protein